MAQFEPHSGSGRRRSRTPRLDMTAMVDVAFLLLTFFVLTTQLTDARYAVKLLTPVPDGPPGPVPEEKLLTLIPGDQHLVHYYFGQPGGEVHSTHLGSDGLRKVLFQHLHRHPNRCQGTNTAGGCWDPIVILKPGTHARYSDLIDVLDELAIAGANKYSFGRLNPADSLLLADNRLR